MGPSAKSKKSVGSNTEEAGAVARCAAVKEIQEADRSSTHEGREEA